MIRLFSDTHVHPFSYGARQTEKGNSRLRDADAVYRAALVADSPLIGAAGLLPDLILHGGDIWHARGTLPTAAANAIALAHQETSHHHITFAAVAGNHDLVSRAGGESALRLIAAADHSATVAERPKVITHGDIVIMLIPYYDGQLLRAVQEILPQLSGHDGKRAILLAHQGFVPRNGEIPFPGEAYYTPDILLPLRALVDLRLAAFGHWHQPRLWVGEEEAKLQNDCVFSLSEPSFVLLGATLQHNWGDAGQHRGWWSLDTHSDPWRIAFHDSGAPKFLTISPGDQHNARSGYDFIRYLGNRDQADLDDVTPTECIPQIEPEERDGDRIELQIAEDEFQTFARYVRAKIDDPEKQKRLIQLGCRFLSEVSQ